MAKRKRPGEVHIHKHSHLETDDDKVENKIYNYLKTFKSQIMGALEDIKTKLAASNEKISVLTTATEGVKQDVKFIKDKLAANEGGLDAAGVAEISALIDDQDTKLNDAATKLQELDAETDSTTPEPEPGEEEEV